MPANKQVGYGSGEPFTKRRWSKWHGGFLACSGEKSLVRQKGDGLDHSSDEGLVGNVGDGFDRGGRML